MTSSIAAIHVAKKQLGLDDETYRAKLTNITGKSSTKAMTEVERQKVLKVFRNEGFAPAEAGAGNRKQLSGKFAKKLQALWIAGWNLGIFRNREDAALEAFVKRQTGLDAVRFCHVANDARKAIEALKAILARDGWVDWTVFDGQPTHYTKHGYRIARAQWKKLAGTSDSFWRAVWEITGPIATDKLTDKQWQSVMNALGEKVRALPKKAGA